MNAAQIRKAIAAGEDPKVPPSILARVLARSPILGRPRLDQPRPSSRRVSIRVPEVERLWLEAIGSSPLEYVLYCLLADAPHPDYVLPAVDPSPIAGGEHPGGSCRTELTTVALELPPETCDYLDVRLSGWRTPRGVFLTLLWSWGQGTLPATLVKRVMEIKRAVPQGA